MKNLFFVLSILTIFFSCKDDDVVIDKVTNECVFVQDDNNMDGLIDDDERAIMQSCQESRITSLKELRQNLIGTWELVGHGEGWISSISQPCANIVYSTDGTALYSITNSFIDTTLTLNWDVMTHMNDPSVVGIEYESTPVEGIPFGIVCRDYIFRDATPADGNMYLYQKVN